MSSSRKMVVRCRKCWQDVAVLPDNEPLPECPLCKQPETYHHAVAIQIKKKLLEVADGTATSG